MTLDKNGQKHGNIRLSNRRKKLLTKEFMLDLLENLKDVFNNKENIHIGLCNIEGTSGFYTALKTTCEKHNVTKAIHLFLYRQPWYVSDILESELMDLMVKYQIVSEEDFYYFGEDISEEEYIKMGYYIKKTITKYNGYSVIETEWTDDELETKFPDNLKTNQTVVCENLLR